VVDRKVHEVPEPRRPYASASDTPSSHYLREWCEAGIERARCRRSATDAGRTGAQKAVAERSHFGTWSSKMYHEHGDTPMA